MYDYDDSSLVRLIRVGDKQAFEEIYERYHRQLFFMAMKYLKSKHLSEDAVQDVFVKLWQKRDRLDPSGSVKGYLFVSLKNHVLNMIRSRKHDILSGIDLKEVQRPFQNNTIDEVNYAEYEHIVQKGLAELSERKRKVFELKTFYGFSNSEVADLLLITINTVKVHYYHGSQFIRSYLKKHADV